MSHLVQISEASSLALHSMAFFAHHKGQYISVTRLAELTGASGNHLSKVLQRLSKAGLIEGIRGPAGGYRLLQSSNSVTLLDVYEAIEGPTEGGPCPCNRGYCAFKSCMFDGIFAKASSLIHDYFQGKTLETYSQEILK